ncbi:MAG: Asp23/Gls24 family envelope stress response protein [Sporolactobacillus sp.]
MTEKNNSSVEVDDSQVDLGKIEITPSVIEVIASIAASEIVGVGDKHGNFLTEAAEKLGSRKMRRGVKVDLTPEGIVIDVHLTVKFGVSIPEVSDEVQDHIVQTMKQMTALDVLHVNIHVVGVRFESKDKRLFDDSDAE